jgi:hypothetical protein
MKLLALAGLLLGSSTALAGGFSLMGGADGGVNWTKLSESSFAGALAGAALEARFSDTFGIGLHYRREFASRQATGHEAVAAAVFHASRASSGDVLKLLVGIFNAGKGSDSSRTWAETEGFGLGMMVGREWPLTSGAVLEAGFQGHFLLYSQGGDIGGGLGVSLLGGLRFQLL